MALGIEKLTEATMIAVSLAEGIDERLEDGKFTWLEGVTLIPKVIKVGYIINNAKDIWLEVQDLDEAERQQIVATLEEELDLSNDNIEIMVEQAWAVLIALSSYVKAKEEG